MGFLRALFDIRFTEMITGKIIVFLYIIAMIAIALGYISSVVGAFGNGVAAGLLVLLIVGPIAALFALAYIRVILEVFIVLFRIYENTRVIAGDSGPSIMGGSPAMGGSSARPPSGPSFGGPASGPSFGGPTPSTFSGQGGPGDPPARETYTAPTRVSPVPGTVDSPITTEGEGTQAVDGPGTTYGTGTAPTDPTP